mgnify:CR=1 FL=1
MNFIKLVLLIFGKSQMRGLYEGGQCNINAITSTSNQYKRMMNTMGAGNQNQ